MDAEFMRRLQAGETPFDGRTIFPEDILPLPEAREALVRIIALLRDTWTDAAIFCLYDWYEHDTAILEARSTSWEEIEGYLASDEALYAARTGDTYVKIGLFPTDRKGYFRIDVIDESDETDREGRWVYFDFTSDPSTARRVLDAASPLSVPMLSISAKRYFCWFGELGSVSIPPRSYAEQE